jgi:hypothetical protein
VACVAARVEWPSRGAPGERSDGGGQDASGRSYYFSASTARQTSQRGSRFPAEPCPWTTGKVVLVPFAVVLVVALIVLAWVGLTVMNQR